MKRREFIAGLSVAGWPLLARAQQKTNPTIAVFGGPRGRLEEIRRGLADVGFLEGRDVTIEYHTADGHLERYPALAADLVRQRPAAIIALSGVAAVAAKAATRDIPIIFGTGDDPVEGGLVASLNRPGGNLTGIMLIGAESAEKRLQLLHEAVPVSRGSFFDSRVVRLFES